MDFPLRLPASFPAWLPALFLMATLPASSRGDTPPPDKAPSLYDKVWNAATLYSNPDAPILQQFAIRGNLQLQWAAGNSDHGSYGSRDLPEESRWGDLDVRRWRLGFDSQWFGIWHLQAHADLNAQGWRSSGTDDEWARGLYRRLHDLYLTYAPSPAFKLSLGKNRAHSLSHEYETSSSKIIVFERSLLPATLVAAELTGIWAKGELERWHYNLGLYSGDNRREFSRFDAGAIVQGGLGYDFAGFPAVAHHLERALLKLQYQYSSSSKNDGGPGIYQHAFSLNSDLQAGKWGLYTDLLGGIPRHGSGGAYGVILTPSLFLTKKLQVVLRYQYAHGSGDTLQLHRRYERLAHDLGQAGTGSDYNALYLGFNYYLYGHKLKLMTGAEYHRMSNRHSGTSFNGVTLLTGLRMYF